MVLMSAETDGHWATNRALTLSQHDGATVYFGQNCCLQGHSFCWRRRKLIYFYFYLILDYARHCFLKVVIQTSTIFIMESKDLLHFRLTQGLNWNTAVNHATWFCRARTGNLWKQHLPLLVLLLQYRSQPAWDILQTCTTPAFPHTPVCCQSTSAGILPWSK